MKKTTSATAVLVALLIAVLASGCGVSTEGRPADRDSVDSSAPADEPTDAVAEQAPTSEPAAPAPAASPPAEPEVDAGSGVVQIGEGAYTYEDGLVVEVTGLGRYEPGEYAVGADAADAAITFSITVTNGTAEPVDLAITTVNLTAGTAGNIGEQIFDGDLGFGFEGAVLPGRAATAPFAYAVDAADLGQIVIEIRPGFLTYDAAYFEGAVG